MLAIETYNWKIVGRGRSPVKSFCADEISGYALIGVQIIILFTFACVT